MVAILILIVLVVVAIVVLIIVVVIVVTTTTIMRLGSLDTWAWVPRLGGESALVNRCFARSTC